ncbi:MAG TPA: hypothetical protein VLA05_08445, partial [Coriobacteriia bacterium]|nr:hypothetical protein [Coriobacteriia bacterium]
MRSRVRTRTITLVAEAARRALALTLVASMLMLSVPAGALASIYKMPEEWVSSPTNPGDVGSYGAVWREGWGNDPLPEFNLTIPQPEAGEDEDGFPVKEPAIVGGFYYTTRPGSLDATINAGLWPDAYMAPISDKDNWKLFIDIPSEVNNAQPGDLFSRWFEFPYAPWVAPVVPKWSYEGPFQTFVHYYAKDTTECASGTYAYGVDVTPPDKVENLTAVPGFGMMSPTGWLTQSR